MEIVYRPAPRSICETTWVFSIMSKREFRHPRLMGEIMLLSRVASHELSIVSTLLVGRLALLEGGFSRGSNIRSSWLVWGRRVGSLVLPACPPSSFFPSSSLRGGVGPPTQLGPGSPLVGFIVFPSSSLPLDTGEGVGPPTLLGVLGPLWASLCVIPRRGGG